MKEETKEKLYKKTFEHFKNDFDLENDDSGFKFSFAFALREICNLYHDGMFSELYILGSALSIEWRFDSPYETYDENDIEQKECYEFFLDEFNLRDI
jgi:hypothetical protein